MSRGIGVYVGRKHVVTALVVRTGTSVQLQKYSVELIPETLSSEGENPSSKNIKMNSESLTIRKTLEKIGSKGCFAAVSMSPFHIVTRHFIMPDLPKKEKADAIRYEASHFTRLKITESVCAYRENAIINNAISITANAAKKRAIQTLVINLRRGTVEPATIEPDYVSFSRVCKYFGFTDTKSPHAMIWMDGDLSINMTLVSNGIVFFSQDFRLNGIEAQDRSKLHDELLGAFRYLSENAGGVNPENIFLAGFGDLDGWGAFIQQSFPSTAVSILRPPVETEDSFGASAAVIALGLALGEVGWKAPLGEVSLLPAEHKKMRSMRFFSLLGFAAAAVFLLFILIYFCIQMPMIHSLEKKKVLVDKPLSSFGTAASQSVEDLEFKAAQLQTRFEKLDSFEKSIFSLKSIFVAIVKALPKSFWLQKVTLENNLSKIKSARLRMQGYCFLGEADKEAKQVNEWAQNLAKDPVFSVKFGHLAVDEIKQEKFMGRNMTHFTITAEA